MGNLVKRCDKLAYYGVMGENNSVVYKKMTGFTEISTQKQAKEYKRQYIDEEFESSDIVGYSPSVSYSFDRFSGNDVHTDIIKITDDELLGSDAVRTIIMVDMVSDTEDGGKAAVAREFSVIPETEGASLDAYTYSGTFKVNGKKKNGTAKSDDDWETITFTETV